jgi:hypothetical protein
MVANWQVNHMKPSIKFAVGNDGGRARKLRGLLTLAGTTTLALRYCMAAQRDEKNGFPFTAAMEWHKAALLFVPASTLAELCWRKWERIVHLPRQMAVPIGDQQPCEARSSERCFQPSSEVSLPIAA